MEPKLADELYPAAVYVEPESKGLFDYNNRSEKVSNQESSDRAILFRLGLVRCEATKIASTWMAGFSKFVH